MAQPRIRQRPTTRTHFDDWVSDAINKVLACQDFMPAILPDCYCCLPFFDPNKFTKWQKDLFYLFQKVCNAKRHWTPAISLSREWMQLWLSRPSICNWPLWSCSACNFCHPASVQLPSPLSPLGPISRPLKIPLGNPPCKLGHLPSLSFFICLPSLGGPLGLFTWSTFPLGSCSACYIFLSSCISSSYIWAHPLRPPGLTLSAL